MDFSRRVWLIVLGVWLALLVGLAGLAAVQAYPAWSAAHAGWFPEGQVGACAAVAVLRSVNVVWFFGYGGEPVGIPNWYPEAEAILLRPPLNLWVEIDGKTVDVVVSIFSVPQLQDAPLDPLMTPPHPVRVILWDESTGAILYSAYGLDDPAAGCDFNIRRALRASLSVPLIGLGVMLASGILIGGIVWIGRVRRARRGVTG